jgi:hypothetical protein
MRQERSPRTISRIASGVFHRTSTPSGAAHTMRNVYRFRYKIRRAFRCAWRELKEEAIYAAREARLFQLAIAGPYERQQALHWLNTAIDAGRAELEREPDSNVSGPNVEHSETGSRATRPVQIAKISSATFVHRPEPKNQPAKIPTQSTRHTPRTILYSLLAKSSLTAPARCAIFAFLLPTSGNDQDLSNRAFWSVSTIHRALISRYLLTVPIF